MSRSEASTPDEYIAQLPPERREAIAALDDLPLDVIGEAIARTDLDGYLDRYRVARGSSRATRTATAG